MSKSKKEKRNSLGMGLSALFDNKNQNLTSAIKNLNDSSFPANQENEDFSQKDDFLNNENDGNENPDSEKFSKNSIELAEIDIRFVKPCKDQPRKNFDMNSLFELSESIRKNGILQPILVKPANEDGYHEIIAGERRWRASLMAKLEKIPAIIKKYENENDVFVVSIVENLQRSELLPVEEMDAYIKLYQKGYTHEEIGDLVNKSRSYITNILRLENLPCQIKEFLNEGKITIGHAKILVNYKNPSDLISEIISKDLNVRQTEDLIRKINRQEILQERALENGFEKRSQNKNKSSLNNQNNDASKDHETVELENLISSSIKSDVFIEDDYIKISYKDFADLDRIINLLIVR